MSTPGPTEARTWLAQIVWEVLGWEEHGSLLEAYGVS